MSHDEHEAQNSQSDHLNEWKDVLMRVGRTPTIDLIKMTSNPETKESLSAALWEQANKNGTPIIKEQPNGNYQATFLFRSSNPELKEVTLESADLYDRLLGADNELTPFRHLPGTDIYYLPVDDLPSHACAQYAIKLKLQNDNEEIIQDPYNKSKVIHQKLHIGEQTQPGEKLLEVTSEKVSYMQMKDSTLPPITQLQANSRLKIRIDHFNSEDKSFPDRRDIFTYIPDHFVPATGKVIFMLDGKDSCETITSQLSALAKDNNLFSNTAFVFIDTKKIPKKNPPIRVNEFYFEKENFAKMLSEEIIPKYKQGVTNPDNIILAAHSLAAYPILDLASKHSSDIGGLILISPALNQNKSTNMLNKPNERLASLPIYLQIGQLEDTKPPKIAQDKQDMKNESRLDANRNFHKDLTACGYISSTLTVHPYGHGNIHALQGLQNGLQYIHDHRPVSNLDNAEKITASRHRK